MSISKQDKAILQELGRQIMDIATLPAQEEKIRLWKALNRSHMERPMITIDQLPWNELNVNDELTCLVQDPFWKKIEWSLRESLYKWKHFAVDMVLDPFIGIPMAISDSGFGIGVSETILKTDDTNSVVSHSFKNQLQTEEDIEKLQIRTITHHEEETKLRHETAQEIFDGIAPVRMTGIQPFHMGIWDYISTLMGVENAYIALMDEPEFIHRILRKLTDSSIAAIKQGNALRLFDDSANLCHCSYIYTDELLPGSGLGKGSVSENCWGFGLAQLFSSVSPDITEEFELPYIQEMASYFGMIYYGCCDRLDDRLDLVRRIPHVRKVSCSPWSDRAAFAERIGKDLIMSYKPNPAFLATDTLNEELIRKDLQETCSLAKQYGANLELLQKDISTVRYQPQRLTRWAEIAMEVVCGL